MSPGTAILVAGMHRSGTSALAGALNLLGIPLGRRLLDPGPDNPKGYWEHRDIVVVHERLLAALGSRWDDVRALPAGWLSSEPARRAAAAIIEIVERDFVDTPLWAIKDPRLCRFLPLWFEVLDKSGIRPAVLIMARDPSEVSASIAVRNHWAPPIGEILWLRYVTESLEHSRRVPRSVITFDALLANPAVALSNALSNLDLRANASGSSACESLGRFLDVADRHQVHSDAETPCTEFGILAKRVYESLVEVAQGRGDWPKVMDVAAGFADEWRTQHEVLEAFGGMAQKLHTDTQTAEVHILQLESDLTAQVRWSDEAKAKHEKLQAENADLASKLTAQIQWSEEAQASREALRAKNAELSTRLAAQSKLPDRLATVTEDRDRLNAELARAKAEAVQTQEASAAKLAAVLEDRDRLNAELAQAKAEAVQTQEASAARLAAVMEDRDRLNAELARFAAEAAQAQEASAAKLAAVLEDRDRLNAELAQAKAEAVQTQKASGAKLATVLEDRDRLNAELAGVKAEAARAQAASAAKLATVLEDRDRLDDELAQTAAERKSLSETLAAIHASHSWKMTRPFRAIAEFLGRM